MALKVPTIKTLIEINRHSNRRLYLAQSKRRKDYHFIVDTDGKEIKTKLTFGPRVISAAWMENPHGFNWGEEFYRRPYRLSSVKPFWQGYLTWQEAKLTLGKDFYFECTVEDLNAMIEATTGGPGLANAYVFGERVSGLHRAHGYTVMGVQYYKIDPERHKELGIEADKKRLDSIISQIQEEREREKVKPELENQNES